MTPTILLPGTLCDERVFSGLMPFLSDPMVLDYRIHDRAAEAAEALIKFVPQGSLVIAFSLGGWIMFEMLARWPERFSGAVLVSGNAHPDDPANASARRRKVETARQTGFEAMFETDWPALVGRRSIANHGLRGTMQAMAEACGHEVHARQAEMNIHRPDRRALAEICPVPMLVVAGSEDKLCPFVRYQAAASGPGSQLLVLPDIGHFIPLEAPELLSAAICAEFPKACT